jgi:hypothetical protein
MKPCANRFATARAFAGTALALILASCGGDARAGEIACQRRLVELSGDLRPGPPASGLGGVFARASERFVRMPLDGCTESQRYTAGAFARVTGQIASTAGRIGDDPMRALERRPGLRTSQDFMELQSQIEGFERRRQVLRAELERMTRDAG